MKLTDYLNVLGKDPDWFADQIGVDPVSVRRYIDGSRRPKWDVLARIVEKTGGAVSANDFLPSAMSRPQLVDERITAPAAA